MKKKSKPTEAASPRRTDIIAAMEASAKSGRSLDASVRSQENAAVELFFDCCHWLTSRTNSRAAGEVVVSAASGEPVHHFIVPDRVFNSEIAAILEAIVAGDDILIVVRPQNHERKPVDE